MISCKDKYLIIINSSKELPHLKFIYTEQYFYSIFTISQNPEHGLNRLRTPTGDLIKAAAELFSFLPAELSHQMASWISHSPWSWVFISWRIMAFHSIEIFKTFENINNFWMLHHSENFDEFQWKILPFISVGEEKIGLILKRI